MESQYNTHAVLQSALGIKNRSWRLSLGANLKSCPTLSSGGLERQELEIIRDRSGRVNQLRMGELVLMKQESSSNSANFHPLQTPFLTLKCLVAFHCSPGLEQNPGVWERTRSARG